MVGFQSEFDILSDDFLVSLKSFLRNPDWTYLYFSEGDHSNGLQVWAISADDNSANSAMASPGWPVTSGDGNPTYSYHFDGDSKIYEYHPLEKSVGYEPFLFKTHHHHDKYKTDWEFSQSARLLLELWLDPADKNLYQINASADKELAVEFGQDFVRIKTTLIDSLLGIRGKNLLQLFEVVTPISQEQEILREDKTSKEFNSQMHYYGNDNDAFLARFQAISGKFRYLPKGVEETILCMENPPSHDRSFIVGRDSDGNLVTSTSNPEKLNNYFDSNPGALPYLTPVFFKRDVLTKYVDDPETYSLEPSRLFCGHIWSLPIDTTYDNEVMVWLGDLWQYMPETEYFHWRHHNAYSSAQISEETIRRDILGQWVDSNDAILALRNSVHKLNAEWKNTFGQGFFSDLGEFDQTRLTTLTYPTNSSHKGILSQIERLALLLIESINTENLPALKEGGSISRLTAFLEANGAPNAKSMVANLKSLYLTRTKSSAHRIGSDGIQKFEKLKANNEIKGNFHRLVEGLINDLESLSAFAAEIRT